MGIEQGIPVVGNRTDLLPQIDLLDLRLSRAFKAWAEFKTRHEPKVTAIGTLSVEEVVALGNDLSLEISHALGTEALTDQSRCIDGQKVVTLTNSVSGEGNRAIFMRHGEQSPPEWVFSIPNPGLRKIRMMQNPFNKEDLLTNKAFVDAFLTAFSLLYVKAVTGKQVRVLSSENSRAKEVGEIISTIIPGSSFSTVDGLSCIIYKDEKDDPPISIEEILVDIPSGFMPWEPELVDKLCKDTRDGVKQSKVITNTIGGFLKEGTKGKGNDLYIVLTHSQQLAEVMRLTGQFHDSSVRLPELGMVVLIDQDQRHVLPAGVLVENSVRLKKRDMRKTLEDLGDGYEWYKIRRFEYDTGQKIPFLVSPEPLNLSKEESMEILRIGEDITAFMHVADELYRDEADVKNLLNRGKPKNFQGDQETKYLFVRPDLLLTDKGFSVCEIETSPFGMALAELLNRAYRSVGFNTIVDNGVMQEFIANNTPSQGTIVYSEKTASYEGQLRFLAKEIFSGNGRRWSAEQADFALGKNHQNIYRGFYPYEFLIDMFVHGLVQSSLSNGESIFPSLTPHMEEKALLALLWDKRWEPVLAGKLGRASLDHLREVVPPTWVVGQEQFFVPGLPCGMSSSEDLAGLSKSKRRFVLKKSGFGAGSSWAEGVNFLHEKSTDKARQLLSLASKDTESLYVIQEFRASREQAMSYNKDRQTVEQMNAKIRITPYFSMVGTNEGRLIGIKATGCADTNYIHASTGSINTTIAVA